MRLYGRKFANRSIKKRINVAAETRDGILWDIDWVNFLARVKIQGSNEYINCYFPRNEATIPPWMKPGNAVRIVHRTGTRGFSEIIGHGMAIPTPVPGYSSHPSSAALSDGIVSGCEVLSTTPASMSVIITDGTYRINEQLYTLSGGAVGYFTTDESDPPITTSEIYPEAETDQTDRYYQTSETDPPMVTSELFPLASTGDIYAVHTLDPAPAGAYQARYDAFEVGIDGIIHYIKGTASTNPTKPALTADHVQIGKYILVYHGMTEVTNGDIGREFTERAQACLAISHVDEFAWDTGTSYPETNITVTVKDQYGWALSGNYTILLNNISGTGLIYSGDTGWDDSIVSQSFVGSGYTFVYQRNQTFSETSPLFMAIITASDSIDDIGITAFSKLVLIGVFGLKIEGPPSINDVYQTITDPGSGTVTITWTAGKNAQLLVERDLTLAFEEAFDGDKIILRIIQDGTGARVVTLPASVEYGDEITEASISLEADTRSYLGFIYHAASGSYDLVANVSGYS